MAGCQQSDRLAVCFDTCHAHAAGYEFRDARSYRATLREFDREVGLDRLLAFHFNDSKHPLGSRKDRHEHIGQGLLGLEPFRFLVNDPRFRGIPMTLELDPKEGAIPKNLAALRSLVQ